MDLTTTAIRASAILGATAILAASLLAGCAYRTHVDRHYQICKKSTTTTEAFDKCMELMNPSSPAQPEPDHGYKPIHLVGQGIYTTLPWE